MILTPQHRVILAAVSYGYPFDGVGESDAAVAGRKTILRNMYQSGFVTEDYEITEAGLYAISAEREKKIAAERRERNTAPRGEASMTFELVPGLGRRRPGYAGNHVVSDSGVYAE